VTTLLGQSISQAQQNPKLNVQILVATMVKTTVSLALTEPIGDKALRSNAHLHEKIGVNLLILLLQRFLCGAFCGV
jgi:hypothetical protein